MIKLIAMVGLMLYFMAKQRKMLMVILSLMMLVEILKADLLALSWVEKKTMSRMPKVMSLRMLKVMQLLQKISMVILLRKMLNGALQLQMALKHLVVGLLVEISMKLMKMVRLFGMKKHRVIK